MLAFGKSYADFFSYNAHLPVCHGGVAQVSQASAGLFSGAIMESGEQKGVVHSLCVFGWYETEHVRARGG